MASPQDIEKLKRNNITGETWEEAFRGVDKTSQKFHDLVEEFTAFVANWKDFSDVRRDRLTNYVTDLENVQDHWEDINKWVENNTDSILDYATSLEDIKGIFQDIADELGGVRRQTLDSVNLVRGLSKLAGDTLVSVKAEGGLTENVVRALNRKGLKLQEEYNTRLRLLGIDSSNFLNAKAKAAALDEELAGYEQQLRSIQNLERAGTRLNYAQREEVRTLKKKIELTSADLELVNEINYRRAEGLIEYNKLLGENLRIQRMGGPKAGDYSYGVAKVNIASRLLNRFGFSEEASGLTRGYGEWSTKRAHADTEVQIAQNLVDKALRNYEHENVDTNSKEYLAKLENYDNRAKALEKEIEDKRDRLAEIKKEIQETKDLVDSLQSDKSIHGYRDKTSGRKATKEQVDAMNKASRDVLSLEQAERNLTKALKERAAELSKVGENKKLLLTQPGGEDVEAARKKLKEAEEYKKSVFVPFEGIKNLLTTELPTLISKLGILIGIALWRRLQTIDEEAVKTKRVIGQWADASAVANTKFVTGVDTLKTMAALGEQFHINPVQVFSPEEIAQIAQAQKLTGMTAEAAGNLGVQSKIIGVNADRYRDSIAAGASKANAMNHSAVNLSAVQNDVLNTSRAITLSYGASVEALSRAASTAASLGMKLQDVEEISKNLMQFESSIQSEMQAQLLTGMQLNLARAREYALNNDLEGVAKEISRQGMDAAKFSHMNYIQQENMAKALGMSREQMSKMLIMQKLNEGLTAKQVAAMTGMRKEDIEAISAREKWQTISQKFLEAVVPLLEPILQTVSDIFRLVSPIVGFVSKIISWISRFGNLIKEDNIYLRALWSTALIIGGVIVKNWIGGARGFLLLGPKLGAMLTGIGAKVGLIGTSIEKWAKSFGKVGLGAKATDAYFDKGVGRWRSSGTGRFVKAPAAGPAAAGTSRLGGAFSSLGKNMGTILKGAAAMLIIASALWVGAKACQEFAKVRWEDLGKAGAMLVGFSIAAIVVGKALSKAGPELLVGAAYLAAFGVALIPVAFAIRLLAPALEAIGTIVVSIGTALKSAFEGIATLCTATFNGLVNVLNVVTLEKAAALIALGGGFLTLAAGITAAGVAMTLFPVATLATILAMSARDKKKPGLSAGESIGESEGIQKENITTSAKELVIQQATVQAEAQQISIEQKATDLSRIEKKMDDIARRISGSRPGWNWLEFDREYRQNVPWVGNK